MNFKCIELSLETFINDDHKLDVYNRTTTQALINGGLVKYDKVAHTCT